MPVPPRFLKRIRELCTKHGIVMIADEVQCGMGRTGRIFAIEHYGIVPDMVVSAKSLGAGMPIGAVTGRAEIMDSAHPGGVGGTYGGSPVACVAAIEAVKMIRQPGVPRPRAAPRRRDARDDERLESALADGRRRARPWPDDARRIRARPAHQRRRSTPDETLQIVRQAVANGVVVMRAGLFSNGIRLLPPLTIPEDVLREGLNALGHAIETVAERLAAAPV